MTMELPIRVRGGDPEPSIILRMTRIYPIRQQLLMNLGIAEIIPLTRTCTELSSLYRDALKSQCKWNINRRLKRFLDDPQRFRSVMASCDALISGSFALQFFEGVHWEDSDLDVFVPNMERDMKTFRDHLIRVEGYSAIESPETDDETGSQTYDMLDFKCDNYTRTDKAGKETRIQIISGDEMPLFKILRGFYTTAILNLITWNRAYALFPKSTFIDHESFALKPNEGDNEQENLCRKYENRGWKMLKTKEDEDPLETPLITRKIGDLATWKITLDKNGVQGSATPDYVLEHNFFGVQKIISIIHNEAFYHIQLREFRSFALKHVYTCNHALLRRKDSKYPRSSGVEFWHKIAKPKFGTLIRQELDKIGSDNWDQLTSHEHFPHGIIDRTAIHNEPTRLDDYREGARVPESWTFYDDLIPAWYRSTLGRPELPGC